LYKNKEEILSPVIVETTAKPIKEVKPPVAKDSKKK
jgi:hypothetical protein